MNIPYEVSCGTPWILLALVIAVLAVPQVVTMEATLRPLTDGGLQSLIDRFDLLLLILVAVIGIGLFVAFVSQLYGISILAKEPNQVHTLRHHVIRRESRSICTRPFCSCKSCLLPRIRTHDLPLLRKILWDLRPCIEVNCRHLRPS